MNFWKDLKTKGKPIIALSPMDGITDYPFRKMVVKYGKPDVIYTEFMCVDQIFHAKNDLISEFLYDETQRPIVAQVFGIDPELFYISAQIVCELGFDGIDINMGCPSKNVAGRGAGAGLIKNPELASRIIESTKKGIVDWVSDGVAKDFPARVYKKLDSTKLALAKLGVKIKSGEKSEYAERLAIPVSVKTRIGYAENEVDTWIPFLVKQNLSCIALHGRTYKQLYHGKADWQAIGQAKEIIDAQVTLNPTLTKPLLLGNGDIQTLEQAHELCNKYKTDGALIGRSFLGKPWLLSAEPVEGLAEQKLFDIILEHSKLQEEFDSKNFFRVRKHLAWYCKGFKGASELRQQLVLSNNFEDVKNILQNFLTR
jgi:tRNA-dihydrouridine synthase